MFDKDNNFKIEFLNVKVTPTIQFVKSRAAFKLSFKDCFGMHHIYFDFLPIKSNNPAIKEIEILYHLNNTVLERCPKLNPKPIPLKLKSRPKRPNGSVPKKADFTPLF